MKHTGGCHCGAVRFEAEAELASALECNCSHCQAKGLLLSFISAEKFALLSGEKSLTRYQFNKKLIDHLFCTVCGVQSFGRGKDNEGNPTIALNVRCIDGIDLTAVKRMPYDGRNSM